MRDAMLANEQPDRKFFYAIRRDWAGLKLEVVIRPAVLKEKNDEKEALT